jgi:nucleotide-binding universal stress UspA family protein
MGSQLQSLSSLRTCIMADEPTFNKILVATDFSPPADAALRQAVWLARQAGASITLVHSLPDLRRVLYSAPYEARLDLLYGEGDKYQREIRKSSDAKMQQQIAMLGASDLTINYETILGEPFLAITHAVQQEGYDLVIAGTRGLAAWGEWFLGSTARRLIRKCPATVWTVKPEHVGPPKTVLAATDFSDVSLKAVSHGLAVARHANAQLHLLHVIDASDVPDDAISHVSAGRSLRDEIDEEARKRLEGFLQSFQADRDRIQQHLSWGTPWKEVKRLAENLSADLIAMGTVGRSGIKGVLVGNTAEKILSTCNCSILTVKPDGFQSPIEPPFWPLHPEN